MKTRNLLPIIALCMLMLLGAFHTSAQNFQFTKRVAASTDDAEERQTGGTIDITSSDIELVYDGSTVGNQTVGLRFTNVEIPKNAIINSVYIQFWVDENQHTAATNLNIYGEAIDNSPTFSTAAFNITSRTKTTTVVGWNNLPLWSTLNAAGNDQRTPDLKNILMEIMARPGWLSGNAVTFLINGSGRRNAHAYDGSTTMAPQLIINYTPIECPVTKFPIAKNDIWMYHDSGKNLGNDWKNFQYTSETSWKFNFAKMGYGDGNESTVLQYGNDASNKYPTYYFRKPFEVADSTLWDSLIFKLRVDDGAVVYLNGEEIFRRNMPSGTISYNTFASSAVFGSAETEYFEFRVGKKLRKGLNVLAVEVHQNDPESGDMGFDMEVYGKKPDMVITNFPVKKGDEWYYNDKGVNLYGTNWTDSLYQQETLWEYGAGPLGYGDPMTTTISFGPNSADKYVTYYFRKKIFIADTGKINADMLSFNIRRDDGAVVFVNGVEVLRSNMPLGPLNNRSISSSIVDGANETTYFTHNVPKSVFKNGINQIAVAIHQRDSVSSDLGFDMEITPVLKPNPPAMGCVGGKEHIACFTSVTPAAQTTRMIIPGSHDFQMLVKQNDPYTLISGNVPGNPDFTAYVGRNGSSTDGVVAINHENSPGAVSLAYVRYVDSTQLWVIDSTKRVDFYNNDLVTTVRNCSGGITPWGTVITSEESTSSADVNADGYLDIGWHVEFNPWTGKVMEYGNGKQEKLWGMGRMSHENIVVLNDSITAYFGEDGGTHLVYKFVADQPGNLSKGKLYVLKLNNPLSSGEPTGTTGTWILVPNTTPSDCNNVASVALALGGTQFNGVEDCEVSPLDGKIYFTAKGLNRTYRFKDNGSTLSEFETFVGGKSYQINDGNNIVTEAWGSGNDNLTFDDQGNLWVLQDGSRNHVWVVRPDHTQSEPKVELFMRSPTGSEPTGMTFTPDFKFMFISIQHPSSSNVNQADATGNSVNFKAAATVVIARKEFLGLTKPIAAFTSNKTTIHQGDSVVFEDISSYKPWNRTWFFEGGNISNSINKIEKVVYNDTGKFAVKIVVSNPKGSDSVETIGYITVLPAKPIVSFVSDKTEIWEGENIQFANTSTGEIDNIEWVFDGGSQVTSTNNNPTITYNSYGNYSVTLTAFNRGGNASLTKTALIVVKRKAPIAAFNTDKTQILKGETVNFTDVSNNVIETRTWYFEGGSPSTANGNNVAVTYNQTGTFMVKLVVANAGGKDSVVKTAHITVKPHAPVAEFVADLVIINKGGVVTFSDMTEQEVDSRTWTFQGGNPSSTTGKIVTVTYPNSGTFDVQLSVTNGSGTNVKLKTAYIAVRDNTTVVDKIESVADFNIYPNPIADKFTVNLFLYNAANVSVVITDINGKAISNLYESLLQYGETILDLDVASLNLEKGIYLLQINIGDKTVTRKIIKN